MSQEKRDLLDSLLLRAPAVGTEISAGTVRLKLGSPLRRRLIHAQIKRGFSAMARSDVDVNLLVYEPDTEIWMHDMDGVGVGGCFRGREGVRALYGEIDAAFERWSWTIDRLADVGDRLGVRGNFVGYGRGSGVKTEVKSGGTVMGLSSQDPVRHWTQALAAGAALQYALRQALAAHPAARGRARSRLPLAQARQLPRRPALARKRKPEWFVHEGMRRLVPAVAEAPGVCSSPLLAAARRDET